MAEQALWAERAWIAGRWQESVLLEVDRQGRWDAITVGVLRAPDHARRLAGPVLPLRKLFFIIAMIKHQV